MVMLPPGDIRTPPPPPLAEEELLVTTQSVSVSRSPVSPDRMAPPPKEFVLLAVPPVIVRSWKLVVTLATRATTNAPHPAVCWSMTAAAGFPGVGPSMVMNLLVDDAMSSAPAVRSIVPAGSTITTSLLLVVVSPFAAATAPRRVAQDVVQTGGEAVSPVPVTTIVVVAACAGTRAIDRATPRRRAPAAV